MACILKTVLVTLMSVSSSQTQSKIITRDITIPSGPKKKPIRVEIFKPTGKGPHPAVILVHGAHGVSNEFRKECTERAMDLVRLGYVVLMPHYFNRTDHKKVNEALIREHFFEWGNTLQDVLHYCKNKVPNVHPNQVGILSYSLGSFLSLWLAARAKNDDERIQGLVEFSGGFPIEVILVDPGEMIRLNLKRIPPTLILHGGKDEIIKVQRADNLEKMLQENKVHCEKKVYPDQGHIFKGDAAEDAWKRTVKFLSAHLKPAKSER